MESLREGRSKRIATVQQLLCPRPRNPESCIVADAIVERAICQPRGPARVV